MNIKQHIYHSLFVIMPLTSSCVLAASALCQSGQTRWQTTPTSQQLTLFFLYAACLSIASWWEALLYEFFCTILWSSMHDQGSLSKGEKGWKVRHQQFLQSFPGGVTQFLPQFIGHSQFPGLALLLKAMVQGKWWEIY